MKVVGLEKKVVGIDSQKEVKKISLFFKEVGQELRLVVWPKASQLFFNTRLVLWSALLFGFGIYGVDLLIKAILRNFAKLLDLIVFR